MMAALQLDSAHLEALASRADLVRANFERTSRIADETASLTGHHQLAARVREFADGWDISRQRLSHSLTVVADGLRAIVDTFGQLDRDLEGAVELADRGGK